MDIFAVAATDVNKFKGTHIQHQLAVVLQVVREVRLQRKQFFFEGVLCALAILLLNGLFPVAHILPLLELHEKRQLLDAVVTVTLDQPLTQGDKLNGCVLLVKGQALSREGVVFLLLVTIIVSNNAKVIWV